MPISKLGLVSLSGALLAGSGVAIAGCSGDDGGVTGGAPFGDAASPPVTEADADDDPTSPPGKEPPADAGPTTIPLDLSGVAAGKWAWFEFPNTVCRDGSPTGFALSLSPGGTKKLMFYLEGGGACFNPLTCVANPANVKNKKPGERGVFDRTKAENPFADYTQVFVPYCTGDVHAGNRPDANVAGAKQQFVGYTNTEWFLKKLAATFPELERLVVTGISAGGFGAAANFGQALRIFPSIPVNLVNDSGQLMRQAPLAHCLQEQWKNTWGFDKTILTDCGPDCSGQADFLQAAAENVVRRSKNAVGLISATGDDVIRFFFGFGNDGCRGIPLPVSEAAFAAGLEDIKTRLAPHDNFGAFLYPGTNHVVLADDKFYSTKIGQTSVADWVRGIVDGDTVSNVGP